MQLKTKFQSIVAMGLFAVAVVTAAARTAPVDNETLGDKIKHLFVRPTPTPKPTKHRKKPAAKKTPTPSPTASPSASPSSTPAASVSQTPTASAMARPAATKSVTPVPSKTPQPTATPSATPKLTPSEPSRAESQYFEPVRPIAPGPRSRPRAMPTPRVIPTPMVEESARPTPGLPPPSPVGSMPILRASAVPAPKKDKGTSTIAVAEIAEAESYTPEVRRVIELGLKLSTENLSYKYNSADPARGGMDCSGFIQYVLTRSGIKDVPRDARDQYIWVRKTGKFQAVLSERDDTFELNELKPGDLLFWAASYGKTRDPDITQTMIYLGREKGTNQRIMLGSSEGRTYKGKPRNGVSVLDFKVARGKTKSGSESGPIFVGYGPIPGAAH